MLSREVHLSGVYSKTVSKDKKPTVEMCSCQLLSMNVEHYNPFHLKAISTYIVPVSPTPNQAEMRTLSNIEQGAQPRVYYYQCSRGIV